MPTVGSIIGMSLLAAAMLTLFVVVTIQHKRQLQEYVRLREEIALLGQEESDLVAEVRERLDRTVPEAIQTPPSEVMRRAQERWGMPTAVVVTGAVLARRWVRRNKVALTGVGSAVILGGLGWMVGQDTSGHLEAEPAPRVTASPSGLSPSWPHTPRPSTTTATVTATDTTASTAGGSATRRATRTSAASGQPAGTPRRPQPTRPPGSPAGPPSSPEPPRNSPPAATPTPGGQEPSEVTELCLVDAQVEVRRLRLARIQAICREEPR